MSISRSDSGPALQPPGEFARLVQPHLSGLRAAARRVLGDETAARDVVQDVLIVLWQRGELPAELGAWLAATVRLRSLHALRGHGRRRRHEQAVAALHCEECRRFDPQAVAANRELRESLLEAIDTLAWAQRDVFLLREVDGLDYEDIAERLALPVGTVRSRLARARAALQRHLAPSRDAARTLPSRNFRAAAGKRPTRTAAV